jgi:hypothetical protein
MCLECELRGSSWSRALCRDPLARAKPRPAPRVMPRLPRDPITFELFPHYRSLAEQRQLETPGWPTRSLHLEP